MNVAFFVIGYLAGGLFTGALIFFGYRIGERKERGWTLRVEPPLDDEQTAKAREEFFRNALATGWGTRNRSGGA